jgi:hypothetical protein
MSEDIKRVTDDENQMKLPLIFTHVYDTVEICSAVPWDELDDKTQRLAKKVVDYYRMKASVNVDAQVDICALNIEGGYEDLGMLFSLVATVESLDGEDIDYESLFCEHDDDNS